jgi:hypothetical protein
MSHFGYIAYGCAREPVRAVPDYRGDVRSR